MAGNNPNFYGYVKDSNTRFDVLGLDEITIIRQDIPFGSGNHYSLIYNDSNGKQQMTHLTINNKNKIEIKSGASKISLDDIDMADKKTIKVTGNLDDTISKATQKFNGKDYKLNVSDCFRYIESIIAKTKPSLAIKGKTNLDRFNYLDACK